MPTDLPATGVWFTDAECATVLLPSLKLAMREARHGGTLAPGTQAVREALDRSARRRQVEAGARFGRPMSDAGHAAGPPGDIAAMSRNGEIGTAAAAGLLGVSDRQARRLLVAGGVPARRVGRSDLWSRAAVVGLASARPRAA